MPSDKEISKIGKLLSAQKRYKLPELHPLPGGVETLLNHPLAKELPDKNPKGRNTYLYALVEETPETYENFICNLRAGQFIKVAAASVGISYDLVMKWGSRGKRDIEIDKDSHYSRFVKDVLIAIAQCRGAIESNLAHIDPKKWLAQGVGNALGNEWSDKDEIRQVEQFLTEEPEEEKDSIAMNVLKLDNDTIKAAEEELKIAKVDNNNN